MIRTPEKSDIGRRVKLLWVADDTFYNGVVQSISKLDWIILYDDGEVRPSSDAGITKMQWLPDENAV